MIKINKPITFLTDEQCVGVAKILAKDSFESLSYINRSFGQGRVEIFFNNQEMKLDLRKYSYIDYVQLKPVIAHLGVENNLEYINFLLKNDFLILSSE